MLAEYLQLLMVFQGISSLKLFLPQKEVLP